MNIKNQKNLYKMIVYFKKEISIHFNNLLGKTVQIKLKNNNLFCQIKMMNKKFKKELIYNKNTKCLDKLNEKIIL